MSRKTLVLLPASEHKITADELQLIRDFRNLEKDSREILRSIIHDYATNPLCRKKPPRLRMIDGESSS